MKAILTIDGKVLKGKKATKYQGDDIVIAMTIRDAGSSLNIDNLTELYAYLVVNGTTAKQFSKAGTGNAVALVKISTTSYTLTWASADTDEATLGEYTLEINVDQSAVNDILVNKVFDLKESNIKDESS